MSKGKKYYVKEAGFDHLMNAGILRWQNENILKELGFEEINFSASDNPVQQLKSWLSVFAFASRLNQQDIVIFHFPLHSTKNKLLLKQLAKKNIPAAVIIVDIDGLRDRDNALLQKEIKLLMQFKWIIAHNDAMKQFIEKRLPSKEVISIGIFDYPTTGIPTTASLQAPVCFAGNIEKSTFIYSLDDVDVNIYGLGFDNSKAKKNLHYEGAFDATILPDKLDGSFGLVWDGDDINCGDPYLQFNNPHKLSLYLAAGMPVIVWDKSAVADLVIQNGIGFAIGRLTDLQNKLNSITPAHYQQMLQQASSLGKKIRTGYFLKQIIQQIAQ